jgi:hypothetical protein
MRCENSERASTGRREGGTEGVVTWWEEKDGADTEAAAAEVNAGACAEASEREALVGDRVEGDGEAAGLSASAPMGGGEWGGGKGPIASGESVSGLCGGEVKRWVENWPAAYECAGDAEAEAEAEVDADEDNGCG